MNPTGTARGSTGWGSLTLALLVGACGGGTTLVEGDDGDGGGDSPESWLAPVADVGEVGWRDSTIPWEPAARNCAPGSAAFDLRADDDSVFTFLRFDSGDVADSLAVQVFSANDGAGWRDLYVDEGCSWSELPCMDYLGGMTGRGLLAFGQQGAGYVDAEAFQVEPLLLPLSGSGGLFVVNENLAYAVWEDKVVHWDGTSWSPIPATLPYSVAALWADEDRLIAVGGRGTVLSLEDGAWRIIDADTLRDFRLVWGLGTDELWIATGGGGGNPLEHFDGSTWSELPWPNLGTDVAHACAETAVDGMWGSGGTMYFHTSREFFMWDGTGFVMLGYWPGVPTSLGDDGPWCVGDVEISAMWGNSAGDVFLAVVATGHAGEPCPTRHVLRWDGSAFHWM